MLQHRAPSSQDTGSLALDLSGDQELPCPTPCFPALGTGWQHPAHPAAGGPDTQGYDGRSFVFSLFVYIQLNSDVLPE